MLKLHDRYIGVHYTIPSPSEYAWKALKKKEKRKGIEEKKRTKCSHSGSNKKNTVIKQNKTT